MAEEGARLTSFYSFPTCTPSRAALLTGRYPIRSGMVRVLHPREKFGLPESEVTLPEMLKERGYATALIGKWHLGDLPPYRPTRHGFDLHYGLLYSNDMTLRPPNMHRLRLYRDDTVIEWPVRQETLTRRYTEQALAFIESNKERPFFLLLAHTMPHVPLHVSREFRKRSRRGLYGDAVEEIDWSTGRLLAALQRLGLDHRSLVIFTSDNGPAVTLRLRGGSAGPLRGGKGTAWEGGVRVPFIMRWPGRIPGGAVSLGIATLMDLFPTCIDLAGGAIPPDLLIDGRNILGMLAGRQPSPHEEFYYYFGPRILAARWRQWKLHVLRRETGRLGREHFRECTPPELYDLDRDPSESFDLSAAEPGVVARLAGLIERFQAGATPGKLPPPLRMGW
jgi:arylsulfatase A-like enzyme